MIKYIFSFFLILFFSISHAKELHDCTLLDHNITIEQKQELIKIINNHNLLTEGKTTGIACWGGVEARLNITCNNKYYLLYMMCPCLPDCPYTFILEPLDSPFQENKKEDIKIIVKRMKDRRIFENEKLYKELTQFLKKLSPNK